MLEVDGGVSFLKERDICILWICHVIGANADIMVSISDCKPL